MEKSFFIIYVGQSFSILSSSTVQFSIMWWITIQTESALALTIASVIGLLTLAVIGLFAGVWIDRFNRKRIIVVADGAVALSSLLLAALFLFGIESLAFVYLILFIRAMGETFHKPALQAMIPLFSPLARLEEKLVAVIMFIKLGEGPPPKKYHKGGKLQMSSSYSDEFKAQVLKECQEVGNVALVARRHEISKNTVYTWKNRVRKNGSVKTPTKNGNQEFKKIQKRFQEINTENNQLNLATPITSWEKRYAMSR